MRVKKGNQEFRISDNSLGDYLARGYDLIDEKGNVIKLGKNEQTVEAIARENKELRRSNRQMEEGIRQRDDLIALLKAELAATKATAQDDKDPDVADPGQQSLLDEEKRKAATSAAATAQDDKEKGDTKPKRGEK